MGQVALGFRSLFVKLAIFVVLAGMLAWLLGGELLPRPRSANTDQIRFVDSDWHWRVVIDTSEPPQHCWQFVRTVDDDHVDVVLDATWSSRCGPRLHENALLIGGQILGLVAESKEDPVAPTGRWILVVINGEDDFEYKEYQSQFDLERQFARLRAGLTLQEPEASALDRQAALDPDAGSTDTDASE